jgi:hypothetical protein
MQNQSTSKFGICDCSILSIVEVRSLSSLMDSVLKSSSLLLQRPGLRLCVDTGTGHAAGCPVPAKIQPPLAPRATHPRSPVLGSVLDPEIFPPFLRSALLTVIFRRPAPFPFLLRALLFPGPTLSYSSLVRAAKQYSACLPMRQYDSLSLLYQNIFDSPDHLIVPPSLQPLPASLRPSTKSTDSPICCSQNPSLYGSCPSCCI